MWKVSLLVLAFVVADATAGIADQTIGTAAIVVNNVSGTPQNAPTAAALHQGDGLFSNERIETAKDSKAQLLFADQTALSMGPQSNLVLDKFVYDPNRNVGTVVLQTVSGAFRFIGGVADTTPGSSYSVQTPVGTIGIRGTYFEWIVQGNYLWAMLTQGAIEVCLTNNECATVDKPGTYLVTGGNHISDIRYWTGPASDAFSGTRPDSLFLTYLGSLSPPRGPVVTSPTSSPAPTNNPVVLPGQPLPGHH